MPGCYQVSVRNVNMVVIVVCWKCDAERSIAIWRDSSTADGKRMATRILPSPLLMVSERQRGCTAILMVMC